MKRDSARSSLKADTAQLHQRLHELPVFEHLVNGTLKPADYLALMIEFRDFYSRADVEIAQACERHATSLGAYEYFPRCDLLASDVSALASSGVTLEHRSLPCGRELRIRELEDLLGVLYVVDGSVLGGSALHKPIKSLLKANGTDGCSYWHWCQTSGVRHWRLTLELLENCWQVSEDRTRIVASARRTFEVLGWQLSSQRLQQERSCQ